MSGQGAMVMPINDAQRDYIQRVFGASIASDSATGAAPDGGFAKAWRDAVATWRDASDTVDGQISALQSALKSSGDTELEEIAEFGLNGVTGGFKVPLMAILQELNPTALEPRLLGRARSIVARFRGHLDTDERVLGCDENPFGVAVSVRATLGAALGSLDAAIQLAAS